MRIFMMTIAMDAYDVLRAYQNNNINRQQAMRELDDIADQLLEGLELCGGNLFQA